MYVMVLEGLVGVLMAVTHGVVVVGFLLRKPSSLPQCF